jgi:RIO kinase 1
MPPRLVPLLEDGIIDAVIRPLMSGKEAQVYLVEAGGQQRVAKVYKSSNERTFRNRADYTEGRAVRNSRDQRAMGKRSNHGRDRDEQTWKAAEAEMIVKLADAGVRVPAPYAFVEGVLIMECIEGPDGGPAPRLAECTFEPDHAASIFDQTLREVVKMLCADVVHGDLSVYNILLDANGPVIIDFPQAINAASNRNAKTILLRDIANLTGHFKRGRPAEELRFGHEMWAPYERGELRPDLPLTGRFRLPQHEVDAEKLLRQMMAIEEDEAMARRDRDD